MSDIKSVCVYCAMRLGQNPNFAKASKALGEILAKNNIAVVYGGSSLGLMAETANAALANGGKVIGIIPEVLVRKEVAHKNLTESIVVDNMHTRKMTMANKSDAFVVMPGGFGTMDETFEILTWKVLGIHNKPVVIANIDGVYDKLLSFIDYMVEQGLAGEHYRNSFKVANTVEEILPIILNDK